MENTPWYIVRNSIIHGKGVFASRKVPKGTQVIQYTGKIISRKEADNIEAESENGHTHTMLFSIDDKRVIDGRKGGDARFFNHSCDPNCEAVQYDDKIYIESLREIKEGEEFTYDYHLDVPGKITKKTLREYICLCGNKNCRGTQIAKKNLKKALKKKGGKKLKKALKVIQKERFEAWEKKQKSLEEAKSKPNVKVPLLLKDPEEFLFVNKVLPKQLKEGKKSDKKKNDVSNKDNKSDKSVKPVQPPVDLTFQHLSELPKPLSSPAQSVKQTAEESIMQPAKPVATTVTKSTTPASTKQSSKTTTKTRVKKSTNRTVAVKKITKDATTKSSSKKTSSAKGTSTTKKSSAKKSTKKVAPKKVVKKATPKKVVKSSPKKAAKKSSPKSSSKKSMVKKAVKKTGGKKAVKKSSARR